MHQTGNKFCFRCGFVATAGEEVCPADGSTLTKLATDPYIGKTLADKYEVLEMLGRGGMSIVYKVRHLFMQRMEALKMLRVELVSDGDALQRFQQESKAVSTLRHVNVVRVLDFGLLEDDTPFLTMEYLEGKDLGEILKTDGALTPERAIPLFAQLCDGLFHAHQRGVIHRDIKPSNILITRGPSGTELPVIVDFGIAKLLASDGSTVNKLTTTGQVFGSPLYMSPEQCLSKSADERTDIYALGCVLYQVLCGVPPIQGNTPVETMMRQMQEVPRAFAFVKPGHTIPLPLEQCVLKALAKDPEDRFNNMNEFRKALLRAGCLAVSDLPGSTYAEETDTADGAVAGSGFQTHATTGGARLNLRSDESPDGETSESSINSVFQAAREERQRKLADEIQNEGLITKPIFRIGMVLVIIGVIGVVSLLLLPRRTNEALDLGVEEIAQDAPKENAGNSADPSLQNREETAGAAQDEETALDSAAQEPDEIAIERAAGEVEETAMNSDMQDQEEPALGNNALDAQGMAPYRVASRMSFPAINLDLTNMGGSWKFESDKFDLNQEPGDESGDGTVYQIPVHPRYSRTFETAADFMIAELVNKNQNVEVSPLTIRDDAGKNANVTVAMQSISHDDESRLDSFVIYYGSGDNIYALHVVPGKGSNSKTKRFIEKKILPRINPM